MTERKEETEGVRQRQGLHVHIGGSKNEKRDGGRRERKEVGNEPPTSWSPSS